MSGRLSTRFPQHGDILDAFQDGLMGVNDPDGTGKPFLHIVCQDDNLEEAKALIEELGADPQAANAVGLRAIHEAIRYGNENVFAYLLEKTGDAVQADNDFGGSLLHFACQAERPSEAVIAALLKAGADPNKGDKEDWPPIVFALSARRYALVEQLLKAGADPDRSIPGDKTLREAVKEDGEAKLNEIFAKFS